MLTRRLTSEESRAPVRATRDVLAEWTERLRGKARGEFPSKVTAFHDEMAVHGRFGKPCPVCGTKVQRIRYADNETNYCPRCQTERPIARRPLAVAPVEEGLAEIDRRAGAAAQRERVRMSATWPRVIVHADMDAFYAADRATRRSALARAAAARRVRTARAASC